MLKEEAKFFRKLEIFLDMLVLVAALGAAYLLRLQYGSSLLGFRSYAWILLPAFPVWYLLLNHYRLYESIRRLSFSDIVWRVACVHAWGGLSCASAILFIDREQYSRGLFALFILCSFLLLSLQKVAVRKGLGFFRARGFNTRQLLIVGTREKALRFNRLVEEHEDWGLRVAGFLQVNGHPLPEEIGGHRVLGHVRDLVTICKAHPVDEVVFCLPKDLLVEADDYLRELQELGITVRMVLDFYHAHRWKQELSFFHGELPILTFHTKSLDAQQLFFKRSLDIVGGLAGVLATACIFPIIALAIRSDSPGPIFFGQKRIGENGRVFHCWKYRTMFVGAESRQEELSSRNEMNGAVFKIRDDPRITAVGRWLRRTSLDELPQFWNVLKGEMSLVGTRPPTAAEVGLYENWHRRRISIKPGITGLWQVSGRNNIVDFDEIVRLDLDYIDNWSLWLDLRILLRTVKVVLAWEGR